VVTKTAAGSNNRPPPLPPSAKNTNQNDQLRRYGLVGDPATQGAGFYAPADIATSNTNPIDLNYKPKSLIDDGLLPFSEQENFQLLDNLNKLKISSSPKQQEMPTSSQYQTQNMPTYPRAPNLKPPGDQSNTLKHYDDFMNNLK